MGKTTIDLLKEFLESEGLWKTFIHRVENYSIRHSDFSEYGEMLATEETERGEFSRDAIMSAFSWESTPEGHEFWSKFNSDFANYVDNNTENNGGDEIHEELSEEDELPSYETEEGGEYTSLESAIIDQSFFDAFGYAVINSDTDFGKKFLSAVAEELGEEGRKVVLANQYGIKEIV